jgi:DNA-binding MarR family transcriptional regulator
MAERLTQSQRGVMEAIAKMEERGEDGHNLSGDLSRWTGNLTFTMRQLESRGLIDGTYDHYAMEGEEWSYNLTPRGAEFIEAAERIEGAS